MRQRPFRRTANVRVCCLRKRRTRTFAVRGAKWLPKKPILLKYFDDNLQAGEKKSRKDYGGDVV